MFLLGVSDHVMIAHSFSDPFFGPATRMHGATYSIEVEIRAKALGPHHVVMDIGALHASLRRALDTIDYQNLDEHPAFPGRTSTTERVAEHVAGLLAADIARLPEGEAPLPGATLRVLVRESPTAYAGFERAL
ncbi:6-pyruvoyl trahydropterin synthase family protein [Sorangium sp. So ce854]|uniref:6-carboxy-5,6,7,8-tetrahydropterin synthase n=1 Tax=Sorangium cellulosum TaxID=56 RepID=A0A150PUH9_SORCE|nr:6-pyruvoyl tetrahydropterin synthase [Sorangium cellulosum]